ncbi:hypothetical protein C0033_07385 [Clostridium sp. chh4-2]|uniref:hypothetical protein n=1 Tax=Clostridium sp. chh4-2 TaxID=2067550 RepID=UPI000CCE19FB|nr:hypothetical protein [Clostridium sp. chh4-2]PNV62831.1 hypothetical protein C0033_07385 [Clostridium sp. chh4-2]
MLKLCENCKKNNEPTFHGYIDWIKADCYKCPICGNELIDTIITSEEYEIIDSVSDDNFFLDAMVALKEKDPIEFQLKMSQFKSNIHQTQSTEQQESHLPKCPTCGSTNIKPISGTERATSIIGLGIFSKKINKSYKCLNCKHTW